MPLEYFLLLLYKMDHQTFHVDHFKSVELLRDWLEPDTASAISGVLPQSIPNLHLSYSLIRVATILKIHPAKLYEIYNSVLIKHNLLPYYIEHK